MWRPVTHRGFVSAGAVAALTCAAAVALSGAASAERVSAGQRLIAGWSGGGAPERTSDCGGESPDRSIEACSFQIQAATADDAATSIVLYNRANSYASQNRFELAIIDYTAAIGRHPGFPGAFNNRANAYSALGRLADAIADYTEVLALNPDHVGATFNRGVSRVQIGQIDAGIADITHAIDLQPGNPTFVYTRGVVLTEKGDAAAALADFQRTLELAPGHRAALAALQHSAR